MNQRQRKNIPIFIALVSIVLIVLVVALASGGGGGREIAPSGVKNQPYVEGDLTPEQRAALERLALASQSPPTARVEGGIVRFLTASVSIPDSRAQTSREKAFVFLRDYGDFFILENPDQNLHFASLSIDNQGNESIAFSQSINGIPVYGAVVKVNVAPTGDIKAVNGSYIPGSVLPVSPSLTSDQANLVASQTLNVTDAVLVEPPVLLYWDEALFSSNPSQPRLIWQIRLTSRQAGGEWITLVNAMTGEVIRQYSTLKPVSREVWDAKGHNYDEAAANSTQMMDESGYLPGAKQDADAQRAYDYAGDYDRFLEQFNRDGYDGKGGVIKSYIHVKFPVWWIIKAPNAAWWNGAVYFSDGYSAANDVVAHELTHALIESSIIDPNANLNGLVYESQSGALNESYADIFGALVDSDNWLLGEDLPKDFLSRIWQNFSACKAMRDMTNPPNCDQPDHMDNFKTLRANTKPGEDNDYGYVHYNSGIPNKAASLLSEGGTFHGITVKAIGRTKFAQIYYYTIIGFLTPTSSFRDARDATILACFQQLGNSGITTDDCQQVANAFAAVGIGNTNIAPFIPQPVALTEVSLTAPPAESPAFIETRPPATVASTSTVLIFDTSGSMSEYDPSGTMKIEAAQAAGINILDVIAAENQAAISGSHQLGVVDFSLSAYVAAPLTADISVIESALQALYPGGGTGMPLGLQTALEMFTGGVAGKPIIILLSDGMPNIWKNGESDEAVVRQQVLDLATQAGQQSICIYTIGFGDPSLGSSGGDAGLDEDFLRQVASNSGCGTYQNARDAWQLANVYVGLRHASTGNTLLQKSGQIAQGQNVDIGSVQVPDNQSMMLFTLNWPGSRLNPLLMDPNGRQVDSSYPDASLSTSGSLASIIIQNPMAGQWKVAAQGVDVPEGVTTYNAILSVRPSPAPPASAFPFVLLTLLLGGGAVMVYALMHVTRRSRPLARAVAGPGIAHLTALSGAIVGQVVSLADGLLIGRSAACALRLSDPSVSRQHARLRYTAGRWYIQDMNSAGGTYVNGVRVNATALNNGDRIRVGSTEFEFRA